MQVNLGNYGTLEESDVQSMANPRFIQLNAQLISLMKLNPGLYAPCSRAGLFNHICQSGMDVLDSQYDLILCI